MENTNSVSFLKSTTTRRLRPDEIKFTQLAFDREQTVGFRLENVFSAGEILGMPLSSADVVLFTARYDMLRLRSLPTLEVTVSSSGQKYDYEYMLTNEERDLLTEKMGSFFFRQTGMELRSFCAESNGKSHIPTAR